MNLRQKIKKAKKELEELERKEHGDTMVDMYLHFKRTEELNHVIQAKRKVNSYITHDEPHVINWKKLTYISLQADFGTLAVLKSSNGKPLELNIVKKFLEEATHKLSIYAISVSERTPRMIDENPYRVDYSLAVSYDRTKGKRLYRVMIGYQYEGSDSIFLNNKLIRNKTEKNNK